MSRAGGALQRGLIIGDLVRLSGCGIAREEVGRIPGGTSLEGRVLDVDPSGLSVQVELPWQVGEDPGLGNARDRCRGRGFMSPGRAGVEQTLDRCATDPLHAVGLLQPLIGGVGVLDGVKGGPIGCGLAGSKHEIAQCRTIVVSLGMSSMVPWAEQVLPCRSLCTCSL